MGYLGIAGIAPDPAKARAWYMKAAGQGSHEASRRLERLAAR
jgi:TPR repeat protein